MFCALVFYFVVLHNYSDNNNLARRQRIQYPTSPNIWINHLNCGNLEHNIQTLRENCGNACLQDGASGLNFKEKKTLVHVGDFMKNSLKVFTLNRKIGANLDLKTNFLYFLPYIVFFCIFLSLGELVYVCSLFKHFPLF